ncbi:MAG: hypothetical protein M1541_22205, partial [Acidobacteria bacterium]|nr:hypothetical protein [Acidobacteriota bacterium]
CEAWMQVGPERVAKGSRIRLRPRRRADSLDVLLEGRVARVEGVHHDAQDRAYVAVTLEGDSAHLHGAYGRFYFYPDEIEPAA